MKIQINNDENIKKRIELGLHQYNKKHCHFIQEHSNGG